jgi:hypothetical protein
MKDFGEFYKGQMLKTQVSYSNGFSPARFNNFNNKNHPFIAPPLSGNGIIKGGKNETFQLPPPDGFFFRQV